ncbi:hypothetical protein [Sphingomonas solaris]|uniref:hypothetical protein n=1 Tax=Alterirhizorhabdus solaris TaxID=2529389 RepID=UPI0013968B41|nr:hypothetical protein [Sphingomonas solaris]
MRRSRITDCRAGIHQPDRSTARGDDGIQRSSCRGCGCALMRTGATRIWFLSSLIG